MVNQCHFELQLGQALSTRPDILPTVYCNELAKLQVAGFFSSPNVLFVGVQSNVMLWMFMYSFGFLYSYTKMFFSNARIKYHHFQLELQLNPQKHNLVFQFLKFLLTLVQSPLQQHPQGMSIKVREWFLEFEHCMALYWTCYIWMSNKLYFLVGVLGKYYKFLKLLILWRT